MKSLMNTLLGKSSDPLEIGSPLDSTSPQEYYERMYQRHASEARQQAMNQMQQQQYNQNIYGQNISLDGINLAPWDTYNTKPTFNHHTGCVIKTTSDTVTIENAIGLCGITEWGYMNVPKELNQDSEVIITVWINDISEAKMFRGLVQ